MFDADYFSSVRGASIPVRLAARSFIIPVPQGIGQLMTYQEDVSDDPQRKRGMPILNKKGETKGAGLVFRNYTDGAYQTVRDNGEEMIIVNGISAEQAAKLFAYYNTRIPNPEQATEADIRDVLAYAHDALGIEDFFNSERVKIPGFEIENLHPDCSDCGIFIRRSSEERFALVGLGSGSYAGPASTPQRFQDNVVLVSDSKHAWLVQTSAFLLTYRHPDDKEIKLTDLPAFNIVEGKAPVSALTPA